MRAKTKAKAKAPDHYVVFDFGGVVCRFDPATRLHAFERVTGLSGAEIHAAIWESGLEEKAERGEIDPLTLRSLLLAALGGTIDADTLRAAWSLAFDPDDSVLALIDRLAWPAVLFTNNGPMVEECLDNELFRVRGRFANVFLSWQIGVTKPEPGAFDAVTKELEIEASRLFFVDDSPENVATARSLGWPAEVFTDAVTLARQLEAVGALESA